MRGVGNLRIEGDVLHYTIEMTWDEFGKFLLWKQVENGMTYAVVRDAADDHDDGEVRMTHKRTLPKFPKNAHYRYDIAEIVVHTPDGPVRMRMADEINYEPKRKPGKTKPAKTRHFVR